MRVKQTPASIPASATTAAKASDVVLTGSQESANPLAQASSLKGPVSGDTSAAVFERGAPKAAAVDGAAGPLAPQEVAERFYDAFVHRRFDDMRSLYADNVTFQDEIFRYEDRAGTMGMWKKLLSDPDNVKASYRFERMEGDVAVGRWQADYEVFGRKVHNDIESRLTISDGKIVAHQDRFDLDKWAGQALPLGFLSRLPGAKSLLRDVIRRFAG